MRRIVLLGVLSLGLLAFGSVSVASPAASTDIQSLYDGGRAMQDVTAIAGFAPLIAGGSGEWAAGDFIAGRFANYGLPVEVQKLAVPYFVDRGGTVTVNGVDYAGNAILASKSANLNLPLVWCGAGTIGDFLAVDVAGARSL